MNIHIWHILVCACCQLWLMTFQFISSAWHKTHMSTEFIATCCASSNVESFHITILPFILHFILPCMLDSLFLYEWACVSVFFLVHRCEITPRTSPTENNTRNDMLSIILVFLFCCHSPSPLPNRRCHL